jgi:hypothetical protein
VVFFEEEMTAHAKEKVGALGDVLHQSREEKGGKWWGVGAQ